MSNTYSTIAMQNADGTVTGVLCHWDGQLLYNGRILFEHYTIENAVRTLISSGDIASLGQTADPESTEFIGTNTDSQAVYSSWDEFLEYHASKYNYLFVVDNGWTVQYTNDYNTCICMKLEAALNAVSVHSKAALVS